MSLATTRLLDAVNEHGDGLRVEFVRLGPRWGHRILGVERQQTRSLLHSIEGDETDSFPPSPALQQIDLQQLGDVTAAMLIGMAGRNHWSICVEARPATRSILWDVACRGECEDGHFFGSSYEPFASWQGGSESRVIDVSNGYRYELQLPCGRVSSKLVSSQNSEQLLRIELAPDPAAVTQRWCYEFQQTKPAWP